MVLTEATAIRSAPHCSKYPETSMEKKYSKTVNPKRLCITSQRSEKGKLSYIHSSIVLLDLCKAREARPWMVYHILDLESQIFLTSFGPLKANFLKITSHDHLCFKQTTLRKLFQFEHPERTHQSKILARWKQKNICPYLNCE